MSKIELNLICRLCVQKLEKEKISPLFNNSVYKNTISLPERIKICSSVEIVEGDGLPPQICTSCLSKLDQSFNFRNQCVLADKTLKRLKNINSLVNEIPSLLKVEHSKQIIKVENDDWKITGSVNTENKDTDENILGVNELYNRKNEVNKISKLQEKSEKKNSNHHTENDMKLVGFYNVAEKNLSSGCNNSLQFCSKEKGKLKKQESLKENLNGKKIQLKKRRPRILQKRGKNYNVISENFSFEEKKDFLESSDSNTFQTEMLSLNEKSENLALISTEKSSPKKNFKSDSLNLKKGKTTKSAKVKDKPTSYTCDYCQKVYPSEGGWRYHIHTMHNENYQPFICDLCGQAFKVKKNLQGHKNSIHFHLKLHLCDLCGRGFASKYALKVHKIWHSDEKNFTCDICGTKFRTRGKMNTHKSIHGGPKKFMCHICSRDFRWKKDFEIHVRTHTGEKPFKCSHCGKAFASLTNMKKHEKNHVEKFECGKNSEPFEISGMPVDDRFHRNEFLNFIYNEADGTRNDVLAPREMHPKTYTN